MEKKYLLIVSAVAVIIMVYLLFVMNSQYIRSNQCPEITNITHRPFPMEGNILSFFPGMPIFPFFIIIFFLLIPLIILYSNLQVEKKLSASAELLSKLSDKHNGSKSTQPKPSIGRELVARLLEPKEMAIIERLIEQPKGVPQSDIVRMPGMTKLKAHRLVERLRQKGIITVQRIGKTNQIKLDNRTRSLLSGLE